MPAEDMYYQMNFAGIEFSHLQNFQTDTLVGTYVVYLALHIHTHKDLSWEQMN